MYHVTLADRELHHHFINTCWGLQRHTAGLLRRRGRAGVFTSPIDYAVSPLHQAEFFTRTSRDRLGGWDLVPPQSRPASSTSKHINQLSCLHAQSFKFLTCVRFDQALYFFGKKLLVKNFLVQTLFVTHKFKYPIHLGASFMKLFLLHMIILVRLRSLFVYYATICTILT